MPSTTSQAGRGSFRWVMGMLAGLGLLVAALPVVIILIMSFSGGTNLDFPPSSLSLRWYGAAFDVLFGDKSEGSMSAFSAMSSSLIVGLLTMLASVSVCVPLSYAVVRSRGRWRHLAELLFTLPIVFPLVVLGVAYWLIRRGRRHGAHAWTEATCPACLGLHLVPHRLRLDHREIVGASAK